MSIQDLRQLAANLELRAHIVRTASACMASLGLPCDPVSDALAQQQARQKSPRFAASIRIHGCEQHKTASGLAWRAATHIEELPPYLSLATARERAAEIFEAFAAQTDDDRRRLLDEGEFPFRPQYLTVRDQYGYAIAQMEADTVQGKVIGVWVGKQVFDAAETVVRKLRQDAFELNREAKSLRAGGAAPEQITALRRLAERSIDRASIIELSGLIAA